MGAMPFCPKCGEPIKVDTKYCPSCGYDFKGEGRGDQKCDCPDCGGTGKIKRKNKFLGTIAWWPCQNCGGTGKVRC